MKKRLAKWFLLVANRLDREIVVERFKAIEDYEPKKIGLNIEVTKKDVKKFRKNDKENQSLRKSKQTIITEAQKKIQQEIFEAISRNHLIEYDVFKKGDGFVVSGELKVNVPCQ